jgi:hypothetical protein
MSYFSIYIPHISPYLNHNFIVNELSCYGKISAIDILSNSSNNSNCAFIHFELTWSNNELDGRNLKEDVVYRESNKLPILKHKLAYNNSYWIILRNKSIHNIEEY